MQDSTITYKVTTTGIAEAEAKFQKLGATIKNVTINQNGSVTASGQLTRSQAELANQTDRAAAATSKAGKAQESYFAHIAKTTIQSALINKLFLEFVNVSGQAIQQVDLMRNFPNTMASMGQSTDAASESMQTLRDYVGQVGGNLGDATSYVTRFTGATKDVKSATAIFVGMNNALIAGDSSLEEQRQSMIQFAQALERGKPDLREWRNLTQNMSFQLAQVAKEMGYVNANELGEALTAGEESMAEFTTTLTRLSTGMGPIAQQAMARMNGMQFTFNVLRNALTQGLAAIIDAFGRHNIVAAFNAITQAIRVLAGWVVTTINLVGTLINFIASLFGKGPIFGKFASDAADAANAIGSGAGAAEDLADGIGGAEKNAKKLNKQLASFDKMNVLQEKSSGDDDAGGGGGDFSPGQIGELGDVFGDIGGDLQEASKWAKILAGIFAGLAANAFLKKFFGVDPLKFLISNLKDAAKAALGLGDNLERAAKKSEKAGKESGKSFGSKFGEVLNKGGGKLGSAIGGFLSGIGLTIGTKLGPIIGGALASVGGAIGGAIASAVVAGAAALGVSVGVFVAIVVAAVVAIVAAIWLIWKNWDKIWAFVKDTADTVWQGLQKGWDAITEFFVSAFHTVKDAASTAWEGIKTGLQAVWDFIQPVVSLIYDILTIILGGAFLLVVGAATGLWEGIKWSVDQIWGAITWFGNFTTEIFTKAWETIRNVADWVSDKISTAFNAVRDTIASVLDAVWTKIQEIWNGIWSFIEPIVTTIVDFLSERWENMKTNLTRIFDAIFNYISDIWNKIYGAISGVVKKITDFFAPAARWLYDKGRDIVQGLINGIRSLAEGVRNAIKAVADKIGAFFSGAWNWLYNTGKAIVDGLINGIKSKLNGARDAIADVAHGIRDKIKDIFGIHSPSRLMAEYGDNIGQGLANGIADSSRTIQRSLSKIQDLALDTVSVTTSTNLPDASGVSVDNGANWVEKIAGEISVISGDKSRPVNLTVKIGEDEIASRIIDLINERTNMSGRNQVIV